MIRDIIRSPLLDGIANPLGTFLPSDLANLELWTRYNQGITVTGSGVSQWDDQSGNGNHYKQGTDLDRPQKQADGSILFDGIRQLLVTDAFTELPQPNTVYILFKQVTWTNTDNIYDGISGTKRHALFQSPASPVLIASAGISLILTNDLAVDTYGAIATVYNGTSGRVQLNLTSATTGNIGTDGLTGLTLGAKNDATQFSNIQVKEKIVYSGAHDAATRAQIIGYLQSI